MKTFLPLDFNSGRCRKELNELRHRLAAKAPLKERRDILPFFRDRPHLAALFGIYNLRAFRLDRIAWEYDLFGDFACDLVVGNSFAHTYVFVEFEDAGPRSLFVRQGKKATREWSPRFEHGFGQIIDWFYKLHDRRNSDDHEARFGRRAIDFAGVVVAGRSRDMDAGERLRLEWRREHVLVHSRRIHCLTYDDFADDAAEYLDKTTRRKQV